MSSVGQNSSHFSHICDQTAEICQKYSANSMILMICRKMHEEDKYQRMMMCAIEFSRNGNVGIFILIKFENKFGREISYFNYNSAHNDKCKFTLKLRLLTVSNLFPL